LAPVLGFRPRPLLDLAVHSRTPPSPFGT
jgi:hypothetical protein